MLLAPVKQRQRAHKDLVVFHGVTLASAADTLSNSALRKAAMAALDYLANDPSFMTRICDCRATRLSKKAQSKREAKSNELRNSTMLSTSTPTASGKGDVDSDDDTRQ